jgi:hypothetical protein
MAVCAGLTAAGCLAWLLMAAYGTDLAAQAWRSVFATRWPASAYDFNWYAGVHPASYSLLAPYMYSTIGLRPVAGTATFVTALFAGDAFRRTRLPHATAAGAWLAVSLTANLIAGRATFATGTVFAAAALWLVLAVPTASARRDVPVALLALLSSLASPVSGLFLGVIAAAMVIVPGRRWTGLALGAGAGVPLLAIPLLFPNYGVQPMSWDIWVAPFFGSLILAAVTRDRPVIAVSCLVYAVGVSAAWAAPTPVGSNVERLGLLLVGPLLIGVAAGRAGRPLAVVLVLVALWQVRQPVTDISHGPDPMADPAYNQPVLVELVALRASLTRVEAVPERDHWEAVRLAAQVPLARGWMRQLDTVRDSLFYSGANQATHLSPERYHRWLHDEAVGYIAVSTRPADWASAEEAHLVRAGQPWLKPVWSGEHWRLWRVTDATPLVSAPAAVIASTPASVTVRTPRGGDVLLRYHFSPWMSVSDGGCVAPQGEWTRLHLPAAGTYRVDATYRWSRGDRCG